VIRNADSLDLEPICRAHRQQATFSVGISQAFPSPLYSPLGLREAVSRRGLRGVEVTWFVFLGAFNERIDLSLMYSLAKGSGSLARCDGPRHLPSGTRAQ
jgi:hypothetical protein